MLDKKDIRQLLEILDHGSWPEYRGRDYVKITNMMDCLVNELRRPAQPPVNHRDTEPQGEDQVKKERP